MLSRPAGVQNGENFRRDGTHFVCRTENPFRAEDQKEKAAEWQGRPPASSGCSERRKLPARWNTLRVQNGPSDWCDGTRYVCSRVQRVIRTEKTPGAMKHAARAERRTLSERKIREKNPRNAGATSCVQRVFRTEKTSGAMKHTLCARWNTLRVWGKEIEYENGVI